ANGRHLRDRVRGEPGPRAVHCHRTARSGEDEAAVALLLHRGKGGAGDPEWRVDADAAHPVPAAVSDLELFPDHQAGVLDYYVESPEALERLLDELLACFRLLEVVVRSDGGPPSGRDLGDDRVRDGRIAAGAVLVDACVVDDNRCASR